MIKIIEKIKDILYNHSELSGFELWYTNVRVTLSTHMIYMIIQTYTIQILMRFQRGHISKYSLKYKKTGPEVQIVIDYDGKTTFERKLLEVLIHKF